MIKEKEIVKNFEIYKKGVARLKELERELNKLDTKNFKKEEKEIRKKLKNVALIPEIEEDMIKLKQKIAGIDVDYQQSKLDKRQNRQILILREEEKEIETKILAIKRKISLLEEEAEKALNLAYKNHLTKDEIKTLKNIKTIDGRIKYLKKIFRKEDDKLKRLEEIEKDYQPILVALIDKTSELETMNRKLRNVRNKIKNIEAELPVVEENIAEVRLKEIPSIKKKLLSLGRMFRKEKQSSEKFDLTKEELNKKFIEELAEAKISLAKEKEEMQKEARKTIESLAFQLAREKQELNKKFLEELKKLEEKSENDKKEIYNLFLKRIISLRQKINDLEKFKEEPKKLEDNRETYEKIESEIKELKTELKNFVENSEKEKILAKKKALELIKKELVEKESQEKAEKAEFKSEIANKIIIPKTMEMPKKKLKKIKKSGKIAVYLEDDKFNEFNKELKSLKRTLIRNQEDLKIGAEMQKGLYEKEIKKINEALAKISDNILKMKFNLLLEDNS